MAERESRSRKLVQPGCLHRKLEEAASAPSIAFTDPRQTRAGRFASRFVVLLQIVVLIGAVVIPAAAIAADPTASSDPAAAAPADPTATPEPTPEPTPDPTPKPTPEPTPEATPAPTEAPTPAPTVAPDPTQAPEPTAAPDPTTAPEPTSDPGAGPAEPTASPTEAASETPSGSPEATPSATPAPSPRYVPSGPPTIASDKADYPPGATVTLTGQNWASAEVVHIKVNDTFGSSWNHGVDVTATGTGQIVDVFSLPNWFVSDYDVTATGQVSGVATTTFTDAQPPDVGNLDQCDPPASFTVGSYDCATSGATGWVHGNNDGPYTEGQTVPYRLPFSNLVIGHQYSVAIEWDTTKSGKHAFDYLKTYNATLTNANACDPASCPGSPSTVAIPADLGMQARPDWIANGGSQDSGSFTMWGATLNTAGPYTLTGTYTGDSSTSILIKFTATSANALLAWGGHIADRADWGQDNSAVSITGSPYHMAFLEWHDVTANNETLSGGAQDRSLSAEAVIFPASITIIKDADPNSAQDFSFTTTGGLSPSAFSLDDDSDATLSNTQLFSNIKDFKTYTVVEGTASGWTLSFNSPVCTVSGPTGGSQTGDVPTRTITIDLKEAQDVTCIFKNSRDSGKIELRKDWVGTPGSVDLNIGTSAGGHQTAQVLALTTDGSTGQKTVDTGTYYLSEVVTVAADYDSTLDCFNDTGVGTGGVANDGIQNGTEPTITPGGSDSVAVAKGDDIVCTYTNTRLGSIKIIKDVNPEPDITDFSFRTSATLGVSGNTFSLDDDGINSGTGGDIKNNRSFEHLSPGTVYTVTEDGETGYKLSVLSCTGLDGNDSSDVDTGIVSVNLDPGQTVECTYTNSKLPKIIVEKVTTGVAGGPFTFTTTGGHGFDTTFDITTLTPGNPAGQTFSINDIGLDFTVTELLPLPAGFVFTDVGCEVTTAGAGGTKVDQDATTQTGTIEDLAAGATVTCTFTNSGIGTTRTQGFWATHSDLAWAAWNGGSAGGHTFLGVSSVTGIGDNLICGRAIDTKAKLMGAFWSQISKKSNGSKRTSLDQARMQLLQQLIAAELNASAFNSTPSGGSAMFATWENALCGTNQNAIKTAASQAAAFNEAGDTGLFTPGMSADAKNAKSIANISFWDIIKP